MGSKKNKSRNKSNKRGRKHRAVLTEALAVATQNRAAKIAGQHHHDVAPAPSSIARIHQRNNLHQYQSSSYEEETSSTGYHTGVTSSSFAIMKPSKNYVYLTKAYDGRFRSPEPNVNVDKEIYSNIICLPNWISTQTLYKHNSG